MFRICILLLSLIAQDCRSQDDDDGPYRGKLIGKINSYHHQVSGDVYAVDEWTILLINFNYDGTGEDTFFWAGDSGRPGPQGFIVPDQHGKTNVLERYYDDEVRLTLPEGKSVSRIKWLAVYDIGTQNAFGDVYVPDEFEAPKAITLGTLAGIGTSSGPVQILDAATLLLPEFRYDGNGEEVYFWVGVGPQPSSRGTIVPDEYGYLEPLPLYLGEDVRLRLSGGSSVFQVSWLALWDRAQGRALAALLLPDAPNVPPALTDTHPYRSTLPFCRQLHRDYQVSWEVFGSQITIQLAGQIGDDEYMAFGVSGDEQRSRMVGADVAVVRYDQRTLQAYAHDYNVTDMAPCVQVLGAWRGVCRDDLLGGQDNVQLLTASRDNGLTVVTFRRVLQPVESMDREWAVGKPLAVMWAVGRLDHSNEPSFHALYPQRDVSLELVKDPPQYDCVPFSVGSRVSPPAWETAALFDPALRVFGFRLGPSGGRRGLAGRGGRGGRGAAPERAFYVNGQLAPDLQLRRGLVYTFKVWGGDDPHSARDYHPLVVTGEPLGGLERLPERAQRAARVLAGVHYTRRGRLSPTAAGPLCVAEHAPNSDRRRDLAYESFRAFNRSLVWNCPERAPAMLTIAPNSSWPDIVYYNSFTHAGMGGRIFVVDRHRRNIAREAKAAAHRSAEPLVAPLAALLGALLLLY